MKAAIGSSNTGASDHDIGDTVNNAPIGTGDGVSAPAVSINQASMNVHAQHTIVSYTPGRGPGVNITMSYNSNYSTYGISAFGSKWVFNYGSTLREENFNDNGQQDPVIITMPDGSTKKYHSSGLSGAPGASGYHYIGEKGDLNTVEKMNRFFTLVFPDGTRWEYQPTYSNAPVFLTKITDPWGLSLQFDYSVSGQLRIKNANNLVTTIYHSGQQNNLKINKIVDPFNRQAYFSYVGDNLTQVIDTGGRVFKYSYDNFYSDLIEIETPKINSADGNWLLHQEGPDSYQAVNYPAPGTDMGNNARIVTTNPLGDHEEFYYDESSGRSFHVTPQNYGPYPYNNDILRQTHYSFGLNFQGERVPIHIQYADNTFVDYRYEQQHGFVNQIIDRQRQVTNLTYNDKGQVTTVTDPKGNITTNTYAPNGFDVTGVAQPNPNLSDNSVQVMSATYDAYHQPLSVTDAGGTTRFSYYNWGALDTIIDPQGHASRNVYNGLGQKTASQYSDAPVNGVYNWNTVEQLTYDSKGRVAQVTDAANLTTGYTYNDFDQVTVTTFPDNTREEVLYLNGDVPVRVKDRAGRYSYAEYDALAQVKKSYVQDAQNNAQVGTTLTNYDKNGNLTALTDAKGNLTRWSYDALDRATGKQYHDGTTETYAYRYGNLPVTNETGLLAQTTGTRGQIIKYAYDANGNQTKIDYPNTPDVLMSYNALDDVAQVTDATGVRNFSYDNYGRLLSDDGPLISDRQTYAYDALQRIQTQTVQRGASGGVQSQSYAYDALGRLASINANGTQGTGLTTYAYDGNTDRLRVLTHPNGTTSDLRYDGLGRLTHVFNGVAGNPLYNRYASNYDTRDIKINTQSSFGSAPIQTNYYSYDALDQLKQERVTGGGANTPYTTNYSYDAMGNRTQVNRTSATATSTTSSTPNALNQLTSLTTSSSFAPTTISNLSYDAAGNLTQSIAPNGGNQNGLPLRRCRPSQSYRKTRRGGRAADGERVRLRLRQSAGSHPRIQLRQRRWRLGQSRRQIPHLRRPGRGAGAQRGQRSYRAVSQRWQHRRHSLAHDGPGRGVLRLRRPRQRHAAHQQCGSGCGALPLRRLRSNARSGRPACGGEPVSLLHQGTARGERIIRLRVALLLAEHGTLD